MHNSLVPGSELPTKDRQTDRQVFSVSTDNLTCTYSAVWCRSCQTPVPRGPPCGGEEEAEGRGGGERRENVQMPTVSFCHLSKNIALVTLAAIDNQFL